MKSFFTLAFFFLTLSAFCQNKEVNWKFKAIKTEPQVYVIRATATINQGWYVYSQYLESDNGPIATHWAFEKEQMVNLIGDPAEEGNKVEGWDELFAMNITKYKKKMVLEHIIKVPKRQRRAKGRITFMSCNDKQCMPPSDIIFDVKLPR
ncbi:MAG: protein-disulfide reductase DsbD domain-containing protein [Aureispira sp.]